MKERLLRIGALVLVAWVLLAVYRFGDLAVQRQRGAVDQLMSRASGKTVFVSITPGYKGDAIVPARSIAMKTSDGTIYFVHPDGREVNIRYPGSRYTFTESLDIALREMPH
jgi:hypothetical protein